MITLIHGDQTDAARNKLVELKTQAAGKDVRELAGKGLDQATFIQALESSSLFGGDVIIFIEGLLSGANKRAKSYGMLITRLLEAGATADIVLFEEKEIDKTTLAKFGTGTMVYLYKTPVVIFQFLDNVRSGNTKELLRLFAAVIVSEAPEVVFALLVRRLRYLIQLVDHITPEGMQPWQLGRLTSQARHFTIDKLVAMHASLLKIDIAVKTGSSPFTLAQHIEQFLISL